MITEKQQQDIYDSIERFLDNHSFGWADPRATYKSLSFPEVIEEMKKGYEDLRFSSSEYFDRNKDKTRFSIDLIWDDTTYKGVFYLNSRAEADFMLEALDELVEQTEV